MGYGNQIRLDVYNAGRSNKICTIYDYTGEQEGAAHNIQRLREMSGWKELSFDMPIRIGNDENWRIQYLTNEYEIRVTDGSTIDWYKMTEPTETDNGLKTELHVVCPHISSILKKKNIYLAFDDTNGIGTLNELAGRALEGTGWSLGTCDTIYENDGITEKIRTYTCEPKTGAYAMIQELCNKFGAWPDFNGNTYQVDLWDRKKHRKMLEMGIDKNLAKMSRTRNTDDIITRLYVEGEYGDQGYVGIDDVNPTGQNFQLNFEYYRAIGALTSEQDTAQQTYLTDMASIRSQIRTLTARKEANITSLQMGWGAQSYVALEADNGVYKADVIYGGDATKADQIKIGDVVASVRYDGQYTYRTVTSLTPAYLEKYAIKFLRPCAGTLGGIEVALEAKQTTVETLTTEMEEAETETEKNSLAEQIQATQHEMASIKLNQWTTMYDCINLMTSIHQDESAIASLMEQMEEVEATFSAAMGSLLQDGYFYDDTYAAGQEQALYEDALVLLDVLSKPQVSYELNEIDLANTPGYSDEIYEMNSSVHFYNPRINVNDFGFVVQIVEMLDIANTRKVKIETDELNIQGKSFGTMMGRIVNAAQTLEDYKSIYGRAGAIGANGLFGADKLDGIIDVLKNRLSSTASNWYTDENGNLIFEAADGSSAMMLTGAGFMVAASKTDGEWNWRTFGTGEGFTADLITAGVLQAGLITILGSDQFYWNDENIYVIDETNHDNQIRIGKYDGEHLGIGYTTDGGITWRTAIGFDGVHFSAADEEWRSNLTLTVSSLTSRIEDVYNGLSSSLIQTASSQTSRIEDVYNGLSSSLIQTASSLTSRIDDVYNGLSSVLIQTASSLTSRIEDVYNGLNSSLIQTASSLTSRIEDVYNGQNSSLIQTASSLTSRIEDVYNGLNSSLIQTASSLTSRIDDVYNGQSSSLVQTASSLTSRIDDVYNGLSSSLIQTASSLTSRIDDTYNGLSSALVQTASSLTSRIEATDGRVSTLTQTVNSLSSTIGTVQTTVGSLGNRVDDIEGSTLYQERDSITAAVGAMTYTEEYFVDPDGDYYRYWDSTEGKYKYDIAPSGYTGTRYRQERKLHINDGVGLVMDKTEGGTTASFGVYNSDNLTAGILVEKINGDSSVVKISADRVDLGAYATAATIEANYVKTSTLTANYLTATQISGSYATIGSVNAVVGDFNKLTSGQIKATELKATLLSGDVQNIAGTTFRSTPLKMGNTASATVLSTSQAAIDFDHSHSISFSVSNAGVVTATIGKTQISNGTATFNIADTAFFKAEMASATSNVKISAWKWDAANNIAYVEKGTSGGDTQGLPSMSISGVGSWNTSTYQRTYKAYAYVEGANREVASIVADATDVATAAWDVGNQAGYRSAAGVITWPSTRTSGDASAMAISYPTTNLTTGTKRYYLTQHPVWFTDDTIYVYIRADSSTASNYVCRMEVDGSSRVTKGWNNAAATVVTPHKDSWPGGNADKQATFTYPISGGSTATKTYTLSASAWGDDDIGDSKKCYAYMMETSDGAAARLVVDASSVYTNGYNAGDSAGYTRGFNAVTVSEGAWTTTSGTTTKTISVSAKTDGTSRSVDVVYPVPTLSGIKNTNSYFRARAYVSDIGYVASQDFTVGSFDITTLSGSIRGRFKVTFKIGGLSYESGEIYK